MTERTMRVMGFRGHGGPEVLQMEARPVPEPGAGEVLIRVHAAGVNRPDIFQREGHYPPPPGAPDWPGLEVAGTVEAAGPDAGEWRHGDAVVALVPGGGYAEYAIAHGESVLPLPRGLDFAAGAALPETFFTVWSNVFDRGRLREGETFLVHGGTSGIGTVAIQLAHAFGARVATTVGSPAKAEAARGLGAEIAIDYRAEAFADRLEGWHGRGVDLTLDMVGGDYLAGNVRVAAPEGRIVQIATLRGRRAELDLALVMTKRLTITGSTLRARDTAFKAAVAANLRERVWPLLEAGAVRPLVEATYPLAEAAEAHRHVERDHIGKVVLTIDG